MSDKIKLQLQEWRGYSAYEIAVKYGFKGTEQEWIDSLKWGDLKVIVNGKKLDDNGEIVLYGSDIRVMDGGLYTVEEKIKQLGEGKIGSEDVLNTLDSDEKKKALSAAMGKELKTAVLTKAELFMAELTIPVSGWSSTEPHTQTIEVAGITEECGVILTDYPDGSNNEAAFAECGLKLVGRSKNAVTVRVEEIPEAAFKANLLVLMPGVKK